jgi:hypothetical protein
MSRLLRFCSGKGGEGGYCFGALWGVDWRCWRSARGRVEKLAWEVWGWGWGQVQVQAISITTSAPPAHHQPTTYRTVRASKPVQGATPQRMQARGVPTTSNVPRTPPYRSVPLIMYNTLESSTFSLGNSQDLVGLCDRGTKPPHELGHPRPLLQPPALHNRRLLEREPSEPINTLNQPTEESSTEERPLHEKDLA